MEHLWQKLCNELKLYAKQNGFERVVLGLSGGLDSALTAVLAADALGKRNVTAVMMKTKFTSDLSLNIAREISKLNNLNYLEWDIEPLVNAHTVFLREHLKDELKDITFQNIQARLRGELLMAYSNQTGALVLACSNKSEILTGYCTLYGDTAGGLAPIGNLYKTEVFQMASWRNTLSRVLPDAVISRAPSAELSKNQKDEDSLPPYAVLDPILNALYDKKLSIEDAMVLGLNRQTIEYVQSLIQKAAFKRRQMPKTLEI